MSNSTCSNSLSLEEFIENGWNVVHECPNTPFEDSLLQANFIVKENTRHHWSKMFQIEKFEKGGKKFHSITTNGVQVSVLLEIPKR